MLVNSKCEAQRLTECLGVCFLNGIERRTLSVARRENAVGVCSAKMDKMS